MYFLGLMVGIDMGGYLFFYQYGQQVYIWDRVEELLKNFIDIFIVSLFIFVFVEIFFVVSFVVVVE